MKPAARLRAVVLGLLLAGGAGAALLLQAPDSLRIASERHIPSQLRVDREQFDAALSASGLGLRHAGRIAGQTSVAAAGSALAQAIRFSRSQAQTASPQPIPEQVATALAPFFPAGTLRKVRWTIAGRRFSLGTVLAGWYYREGAVTLVDIIVFSNEHTASDIELWAHELVHVRQYEELGVDDFARLYVSYWRAVEHQARSNAREIARRRAPPARRAEQKSAIVSPKQSNLAVRYSWASRSASRS